MSRKQNLPALPVVSFFEVAPHRYLYDAKFDAEIDLTSMRAVRNAAPYKAGEVIFVVYGDGFAKAYVHAVFCSRTYYGDLREYYEVRRETKAGEWSKRTYQVHPGQVQRGYQRAGLAPDIPE